MDSSETDSNNSLKNPDLPDPLELKYTSLDEGKAKGVLLMVERQKYSDLVEACWDQSKTLSEARIFEDEDDLTFDSLKNVQKCANALQQNCLSILEFLRDFSQNFFGTCSNSKHFSIPHFECSGKDMWRKEFEANILELTKSLRVTPPPNMGLFQERYHSKKVAEFDQEVLELEKKFEEEFK